MKKTLLTTAVMMAAGTAFHADAQITKLQDYQHNSPVTIGTHQGIVIKEGGFSSLRYINNTDGKEFWVSTDRGPNIDAATANPSSCTPTYDKIYPFPSYVPKIHRIRIHADSIQILRTITIKRPNNTGVSGLLNPTGLGSTAAEVASTDTVLNCANFNSKIAAKDTFGMDPEGIVVDQQGYFWLCEEGGPTIWKLDQNGKVMKRYTPYFNMGGAQAVDVAIDTVFKYRKNNRGFENLTMTPSGKLYAVIQSPLLYPDKTTGENTRIHRILELDPSNGNMRMFAYLNDGIIGASGSNQIRLRDWKLGDITAINDTTFLIMEAALRGTSDYRRMYKISINGATVVTSGYVYGGLSLEALVDSAGLAGKSIVPVKKTLFMDLLVNGWPAAYEKAEGLTIINDSTIVLCNDNDYGIASLPENGIIAATGIGSHMITYRLAGANKLVNYVPLNTGYDQGRSGISSSQAPYLTPMVQDAWFKSITTAGDKIGGYTVCGIPDGAGAFDNGNGTFTMLVNHEIPNTSGGLRAHGNLGAFVSKYVINKSDLSVVSTGDLIQRIFLWSTITNSYVAYNASSPIPVPTIPSLSRFCSADLPAVSAYYNSATGKGTQERIFMNGEESGSEGRGFAHIATGPNAGTSYELPYLGKCSWENAVACPSSGDTTVVVGLDDATPGQVYVYIGAKSVSGTEIEKAGLTGGKLTGIAVTGMATESSSGVPAANTVFSLKSLGNVQNMTGSFINTNSNTLGITTFLRPEDGAWDPANPNDFYFVTTNGFGSPSRMWRARFTNITTPSLGGTITAVLNGTEGQQMLDQITIDNYGNILLQEDVGGNSHNGKIWQYTIATGSFKQVARHDTTRFISGSANYLTQDEEASGIIDVQGILGAGMFLTVDQAHYGISGEVYEGGQILAFYNPDTYNANPEISVMGNSVAITDGDITPSTTDNTDFGSVNKMGSITKTFVINNAGPGSLKLTNINVTGAYASEFNIISPLTFPITVNSGNTQNVTVQFIPATLGTHTAMLNVSTNDFDESRYDFTMQGMGTAPKVNVMGNGINIADGDPTAGSANNTDFGTVNTGSTKNNIFSIQNLGTGPLTITGVTFAGANAAEFTLVSAPTFPLTLAANGSQNITVQFKPTAIGTRTGTINIANDDANVGNYDFAVEGFATEPAGISSASMLSSVKLYPNPTANKATLEMAVKKDMKATITVVDIEGRQAMKAVHSELKQGMQQIELNTDALTNGIYFVNVVSGTETIRVKMVVIH